jgi:signal transduction histidine kinase
MVNELLQEKINEQLYEKLELAYFCVDHAMKVTDVSANLLRYGYGDMPLGADVDEYVDFMVGMDGQTKLDLPLVATPSGTPVSVSLLPSDEQLTVLITNASTQAEHRQMLQQKANENELLVDQQIKLMTKLEQASEELEVKNSQLEEASRLQTSFLSGVSHEFRTPLTSIIGYTNLVKQALQKVDSDKTTSDSSSHLRAVQRSSKHLLSLVENLLDHGKLGSDEIVIRPKPIRLAEIFEDVEILLKPLSDAKRITFECETDFDAEVLSVLDDSRLRQCLINLLGNAVKFTDEGSVSLMASLDQDMLSVQVSDTGPGISNDDLDKIKLPFWQGLDTGKAGTGLGLTITERLIELMGGELRIESQVGQGTKVSFQMHAPIVDGYEPVNTLEGMPVKSLSILLAEDDADIADLVCMMLIEKDILVDHVENGAQAIEALSAKHYDLVLMDIHMPIMSGYEALAELKEQGNPTPVVVMSASSVDADRSRAIDLGCRAYLVKPVDIDDIIGIVDQVIT